MWTEDFDEEGLFDIGVFADENAFRSEGTVDLNDIIQAHRDLFAGKTTIKEINKKMAGMEIVNIDGVGIASVHEYLAQIGRGAGSQKEDNFRVSEGGGYKNIYRMNSDELMIAKGIAQTRLRKVDGFVKTAAQLIVDDVSSAQDHIEQLAKCVAAQVRLEDQVRRITVVYEDRYKACSERIILRGEVVIVDPPKKLIVEPIQ